MHQQMIDKDFYVVGGDSPDVTVLPYCTFLDEIPGDLRKGTSAVGTHLHSFQVERNDIPSVPEFAI
jgi:hypothetical protein